MTTIDRIQARYGIELPPLYLTLLENGHFEYDSESGYIWFHDHEWLPLEAIADYTFLDWQAPYKTWFVPFSKSGRRDEWGWRMDWASERGIPVAFCERGPTGSGFAPDFETFLFRHLVDLFAGAWLDDDPDVTMERLLRNIEILVPHLSPDLGAEIEQLAQREWQFDEMDELWSVMSDDEATTLIQQRLAFDHLDQTFSQEAPPE